MVFIVIDIVVIRAYTERISYHSLHYSKFYYMFGTYLDLNVFTVFGSHEVFSKRIEVKLKTNVRFADIVI